MPGARQSCVLYCYQSQGLVNCYVKVALLDGGRPCMMSSGGCADKAGTLECKVSK